MMVFPWEDVLREAKQSCPTLTGILQTGISRKKARHTSNESHLICVIVCMLCKFRCSSMSLFQRLISAVLYAGHTASVVN